MKTANLILLLPTLLLLGCERKIETQDLPSVQSPPIELGVIPDALTKDFTRLLGDRFIRIGKVNFDSKLNLYHAELFYKDEDTKSEMRYVLEFTPGQREHQTNLTSYRVELPEQIFGKLRQYGGNYIYIDAMSNESNNGQQDGTVQPATRPESHSDGGDEPQPESDVRSR